MFSAFQCAQFASCLGGGHKNYEGYYNQSEKESVGSTPENPAPNNENKGFITLLMICVLFGAMLYIGYLSFDIISTEEKQPVAVVNTSSEKASNDAISNIERRQIMEHASDYVLVKTVYTDGSESMDTLYRAIPAGSAW